MYQQIPWETVRFPWVSAEHILQNSSPIRFRNSKDNHNPKLAIISDVLWRGVNSVTLYLQQVKTISQNKMKSSGKI